MNGYWYFSILMSIASISCHESLPGSYDPGNVFIAGLSTQYIVTETENTIHLCVRFRNVFDETLQDTLLLNGYISIALTRDTSYRKTYVLSGANLVRGKYDPSTNIITADPDSLYILRAIWDFTDDEGRDVRTIMFFQGYPSCIHRDTTIETFTVKGQLTIMNHTNPLVFPPVQFTHIIERQTFYPKSCPGVATISDDDTCN